MFAAFKYKIKQIFNKYSYRKNRSDEGFKPLWNIMKFQGWQQTFWKSIFWKAQIHKLLDLI